MDDGTNSNNIPDRTKDQGSSRKDHKKSEYRRNWDKMSTILQTMRDEGYLPLPTSGLSGDSLPERPQAPGPNRIKANTPHGQINIEYRDIPMRIEVPGKSRVYSQEFVTKVLYLRACAMCHFPLKEGCECFFLASVFVCSNTCGVVWYGPDRMSPFANTRQVQTAG